MTEKEKTLLEKINEENIANIQRRLKEPQDNTEPFILLCPTCKKEVKEHHEDSSQKWYICENGHQKPRSLLIKKELSPFAPFYQKFYKAVEEHPEVFEAYEREKRREITPAELTSTLGSTVKHDDNNKVITFLSLLATYTAEDQTNIGFLAESSSGKSYIPLEIVLGYFDLEDLLVLGYCSPTAFFHDFGTYFPDPNDKRDVEPEKRHKIIHIDLHQKIIIFLDQPHAKLLENLRPLLSHDQKEITLKITDKSEKSGQRAKTVVIEGYPSVVFCSANYKQNEQEKTRLLLLSPEHSQEKLRESIALKIEKESDRDAFKKAVQSNKERQKLANRINELKNAKIDQVIIPTELRETIYSKFLEKHPNLQSRNQRDISRLLTLIKGFTLLNFYNRQWASGLNEEAPTNVTATLEDVENGFKYYDTVSEANELGIPPEIFEIYQTFKEELTETENGFTRKDFQKLYFSKFRKFITRDKAKAFIETLEASGLLIEQPDPLDKRVIRYVCGEGWVDSDNSLPDSTTFPPPPRTHISSYSKEEDQP